MLDRGHARLGEGHARLNDEGMTACTRLKMLGHAVGYSGEY